VLLHVDAAHVGEQATLHGGRTAQGERSLYPFFCSPSEAEELTQNILLSHAKPNATDRATSAIAVN
jgi:hypothetical protein